MLNRMAIVILLLLGILVAYCSVTSDMIMKGDNGESEVEKSEEIAEEEGPQGSSSLDGEPPSPRPAVDSYRGSEDMPQDLQDRIQENSLEEVETGGTGIGTMGGTGIGTIGTSPEHGYFVSSSDEEDDEEEDVGYWDGYWDGYQGSSEDEEEYKVAGTKVKDRGN